MAQKVYDEELDPDYAPTAEGALLRLMCVPPRLVYSQVSLMVDW
jgi:hypothetical protein